MGADDSEDVDIDDEGEEEEMPESDESELWGAPARSGLLPVLDPAEREDEVGEGEAENLLARPSSPAPSRSSHCCGCWCCCVEQPRPLCCAFADCSLSCAANSMSCSRYMSFRIPR